MCCSESTVASGFITPANPTAQRAQRAIEERRWSDAAASTRKIPDAPLDLQAWKSLLTGAVMLGESKLTDALAATFQAAGCAFAIHLASIHLQDAGATQSKVSKENPCPPRQDAGATHAAGATLSASGKENPCAPLQDAGAAKDAAASRDSIRLAAMALTQAGKILRRLDRTDEAQSILQTALHLREQHGSVAEQWESSVELGLTADVARRHDEAASWYQRAIEHAARAEASSNRLQAEAWGHLARSFGSAGQHDQAVEAARRARDLWQAHDPGAATALLADLRLAGALLARTIAVQESGNAQEPTSLDEAIALFDAATEGLPAFGSEFQADAHWAIEQKHFAERLRKQLTP
jgi:tetratricopeptide (TPR) repeat protein